MKKHICEALCLLDNQHITSKMGIFEIWDLKIYTKICKSHSWKWKKGIDSLEIEHKHLETDLKNYQTSQRYLDCKSKLDEIYSKKADGVGRTSKCDWCESGENSNKFILTNSSSNSYTC